MENKNTAWFNNDILPNEMINGATGKNGWLKLEETEHFKVLNDLISNLKIKTIADIGCGSGELGRVLNNLDYTGFDLEHIIENVSKKVNPNLKYEYFDADNYDYSNINKYDLIVCNSFISELTNPLEILNKIIKNTSEYLIIHRQFFSEKTNFSEYKTYGNLTTIRSHIGFSEFNDLLINHKIISRSTNVWGDTVLIKKI